MNTEEAKARIDSYYDRKISLLHQQYVLRSSNACNRFNVRVGMNGSDILSWQILDIIGDAALLLCMTVFTDIGIHEPVAAEDAKSGVTWANSTCRRYLNSKFIENHFNENFRDNIIPTTIRTNDNTEISYRGLPFAEVPCKGKGCGETTDKLFVLSIEECRKYLNLGTGTLGVFGEGEWLRSPGIEEDYFAFYNSGYIFPEGAHYSVTAPNIRPAMFYKLKALL